MDETQERTIAHGLQTGRPDAWRDFYGAFAERVWRGVARLLGPRHADVADIVQETFLAAARSARGFDCERGGLWPWLWGIARNHLALHLRRRQSYARLLERAEESSGDSSPAPDPLESAELSEMIRRTLAALPEEYGSVLTAKYLDEVSVEQLAREERCTEVALRSRLARARAAFRDEFVRSGGIATLAISTSTP